MQLRKIRINKKTLKNQVHTMVTEDKSNAKMTLNM